MKLELVNAAKVIWIFDIATLNPKGMPLTPLLRGIQERYSFSKAPRNVLDRNDKGGLVFEDGAFKTPNGTMANVSLTIFSDGVVAVSRSSTDDTTFFLEDVKQLALGLDFSFPEGQKIGKAFTSEIRVFCNKNMISLNPALDLVNRFIESKAICMDGKARHYELAGIEFWTEDTSKPYAPASFVFERLIGPPFDSNSYFSKAPLQTNEHLQLLEELEKVF